MMKYYGTIGCILRCSISEKLYSVYFWLNWDHTMLPQFGALIGDCFQWRDQNLSSSQQGVRVSLGNANSQLAKLLLV